MGDNFFMDNFFKKSFGNKIKDLREDLDMSQSEVAALIPMNQSNYSKIERDLQEPDLYQLKRISEIFDVSCDELLEIRGGAETSEIHKDLLFAKKIIKLYHSYYGKD